MERQACLSGRKHDRIRGKIKKKMAEHRQADLGIDTEDTYHADQIARLERHARKIDAFLADEQALSWSARSTMAFLKRLKTDYAAF